MEYGQYRPERLKARTLNEAITEQVAKTHFTPFEMDTLDIIRHEVKDLQRSEFPELERKTKK